MKFNEILLRRKNKVLLPEETNNTTEQVSAQYVYSAMKNLEAYGYTFTPEMSQTLSTYPSQVVISFYYEIVEIIESLIGAETARGVVMYPNFPFDIMEKDDAVLFTNAIIHYISNGTLLPLEEKQERFPLITNKDLTALSFGSMEDLVEIRDNIMKSNTSISSQDKEDLLFLYRYLEDKNSVPEIPFKENMVVIASEILNDKNVSASDLKPLVKNATDVLRLYSFISGNDATLVDVKHKFKSLPRATRRTLLNLLNSMSNLEEDIYRHEALWKKAAEMLHVGEYEYTYPNVYDAFYKLRNNIPVQTFGGKVQKLINEHKYVFAAKTLSNRPPELARRLDELLRKSNEKDQDTIITIFRSVANKVSTRVLLQVLEHFYNRDEEQVVRVVFPKGRVDHATVLPDLEPLSESVCFQITSICSTALMEQYAKLPSLGNVYIDDEFSKYIIPYSQRNANKAMKTLTRGSRIKLDEDTDIIRGFVHWTNMDKYDGYNGRVDIDLSASMYTEDWKYKEHISYTNLRNKKLDCYHSGDITNGGSSDGNGASEFLDCNINTLKEAGIRYIVYQVYSYTEQHFCDMPHVSFGWMGRNGLDSGEIYEPSTVEQKLDLCSDASVCIPAIFDCYEREFIWCDMNIKSNTSWSNNVEGNFNTVTGTCASIVYMNKVDMYFLAYLHANARGKLVETREEADIIFSNDTTPVIVEEVKTIESENGKIETERTTYEKDVKFVTAYDIDEFYAMI